MGKTIHHQFVRAQAIRVVSGIIMGRNGRIQVRSVLMDWLTIREELSKVLKELFFIVRTYRIVIKKEECAHIESIAWIQDDELLLRRYCAAV